MEIPIKDFLKIEKRSQSDKLIRKSSAGLELFDVWFVTYQNVGLEIDNIETVSYTHLTLPTTPYV